MQLQVAAECCSRCHSPCARAATQLACCAAPHPNPATLTHSPARSNKGARVINTSFVLTEPHEALRDAIANGTTAGIFFAG